MNFFLFRILFALNVFACINADGMAHLKTYLKHALYHITPASANPMTWYTDNFYEVEKGKCYRSKTVSPRALEKYIKQYDIKTILNLREKSGIWFEKEKEVAQRLGVTLKTISLDSEKLPSNESIKEIFSTFENNKKAILIHCQAGVDRTSLAAAFWKLTQQNASLRESLDQMTPSYGHFEWSRPMMRKFIHTIDALKKQSNSWPEALNKYDAQKEEKKVILRSIPIRMMQSLKNTIYSFLRLNNKM